MVMYEIAASTQTGCPIEIIKIPVSVGDPAFDVNGTVSGIPFTRAKYDKSTGKGFDCPREQLNERTAWIDGSFVYSVVEAWVASMRSFENGTFKEGFEKGLQRDHPRWTDEELFQGARRRVIATIQIPPAMILRKKAEACEFREKVGDFPAVRLCQNWWNAQDVVQEYSVDEFILGMVSQVSEDEDIVIVEDLRVEKEWHTINPKLYESNKDLFDKLVALYGGDIGQLDAFVGAMLEVDGEPGELLKAIMKEQFERLRDSDRFWFENRQNGFLTNEEIELVHSITLKDIIQQTIGIPDQWLPKNVLRLQSDEHLAKFLASFTNMVEKLDGQVSLISMQNEVLLARAETKDLRQEHLDQFFREAYARAFDQQNLRDSEIESDDVDDILHQTITRHEFAQAIGMRETDLFVQRMFAVTAQSDKEVITFVEFLEVLKKFSSGAGSDGDYLTKTDFEAIFLQAGKGRPLGIDMRGAKLKVDLQE
nr:Haem peroxidase domain containing protein [Haemonchus contortus]